MADRTSPRRGARRREPAERRRVRAGAARPGDRGPSHQARSWPPAGAGVVPVRADRAVLRRVVRPRTPGSGPGRGDGPAVRVGLDLRPGGHRRSASCPAGRGGQRVERCDDDRPRRRGGLPPAARGPECAATLRQRGLRAAGNDGDGGGGGRPRSERPTRDDRDGSDDPADDRRPGGTRPAGGDRRARGPTRPTHHEGPADVRLPSRSRASGGGAAPAAA